MNSSPHSIPIGTAAGPDGIPILTPRTVSKAPIVDPKAITVIGVIGEGDFGDVQKATLKSDDGTERVVAVKVIELSEVDESRTIYIKREIQTLSACKHDNILPLVGVCESGNEVRILCDFMGNGDLEQLLISAGGGDDDEGDDDEAEEEKKASAAENLPPLTWRRRLQWLAELVDALLYLHRQGIMHRDLKPDNVLLDDNWSTKLADFGLARILELQEDMSQAERLKSPRAKKSSTKLSTSTTTDNEKKDDSKADNAVNTERRLSICGSNGFIAPEVMLGMQYTHSCDIFSLGVLFASIVLVKIPGDEYWNRDYSPEVDPEEFTALLPEIAETTDENGDQRPDNISSLILDCVQFEAKQRPSLENIKERLEKMRSGLK